MARSENRIDALDVRGLLETTNDLLYATDEEVTDEELESILDDPDAEDEEDEDWEDVDESWVEEDGEEEDMFDGAEND